MPTLFGLMRHATTQWNMDKRIQGHSDIPLCDLGRSEAAKWDVTLPGICWDRILSSDLKRALETAEIINRKLDLPLDTASGLREQHWGLWEGQTLSDINKKYNIELEKQVAAGWRFRPPSGEDRLSVWGRARNVLGEAARKWPGQNILVIAHEGVMKCVLYRLLNRRFLPTERSTLKSAYIHTLRFEHDTLTVGNINASPLNGTKRK